MKRYILRLDDACPGMNTARWNEIESILDRYQIKPIVAVIPHNNDSSLCTWPLIDDFWLRVESWQQKGWHIALHGYDHVYTTRQSGLVGLNRKSEFAGVELYIQKEKMKRGLSIFTLHNITTNIWTAPGHSFDENTLLALRDTSSIRIISDSIAFWPYSYKGFFWIPQQCWRLHKKTYGIWTTCFHPNQMSLHCIIRMKQFIESYRQDFIDDINALIPRYHTRKRSIAEKLYSCYFLFRRNYIIKYLHTIKETAGLRHNGT